MKTAERRKRLLAIMHKLYAQARVQADFTAEVIAHEEQVSVVLVYRLIGPEFKELRGKLPGRRRSPSSVEAELRAEVELLQEQIKLLKAERNNDIQEAIAGLSEILERMDAEIRSLKSENELLQRRVKDGGVVVVRIPQEERESDQDASLEDSGGEGLEGLQEGEKEER